MDQSDTSLGDADIHARSENVAIAVISAAVALFFAATMSAYLWITALDNPGANPEAQEALENPFDTIITELTAIFFDPASFVLVSVAAAALYGAAVYVRGAGGSPGDW